MKTAPIFLLTLFMALSSPIQGGVIGFDPTDGITVFGGGVLVGYEFEVTDSAGITVDALGFWDDQSNGFALNQSFAVGMWRTNGALLTAASVKSTSPLKSSSNLSGGWRMVAVPPRWLAPGFYRVGALLPDLAANPTISDATVFQTAPGVNMVRFLRHIGGTSFVMPDIPPPSPDGTYFAPSFTFKSGAFAVAPGVVAPGNNATVGGNVGLNTLVRITNAPRTYQAQFAAAALGGLPVGARITELRFRQATNNTVNFPTTNLAWAQYQVTLAQAANSVANMSTNFADNLVAPIVVRDGPLTLPAEIFTAGNVPNLFAPLVVFDTPYTYQGGDLVMHVTHSGSDSTNNFFLDSVATTAIASGYGTSFRGISALTNNAVSGTASSVSIVQIGFVPALAITAPGTNLVLTGIGGLTGGGYQIVSSTNLTAPLPEWTLVTTNSFPGGGRFDFTNSIPTNEPVKYFRIRLP